MLNLTLRDVKIDVSDTGSYWVEGKAALSVQGKGNVEIELDGENELKSGVQRAGLEKNTFTSTGTLTLKDDKEAGSGSLKATGSGNMVLASAAATRQRRKHHHHRRQGECYRWLG